MPVRSAPLAADARQDIVATLLQQGLIGHRPRRDDANDLAFHGTLGLTRVTALFAYGNRLAFAHQLRQIAVEGNGRYARHRYRRTGGRTALGQGNVQKLGGAARVVIEHVVEIAHAVEQQDLGMLGLKAQVLLHHGGVLGPGTAGAGVFRWCVDAHLRLIVHVSNSHRIHSPWLVISYRCKLASSGRMRAHHPP